MLPYGQAANQAVKARSPRRDIHVATGLNAPSTALLPHFYSLVCGSIEKGDMKAKSKSEIRAFGANGQISTDNSQQQKRTH